MAEHDSPRQFLLAAAQLGPIARDEPRRSAVARMLYLMHEAQRRDHRSSPGDDRCDAVSLTTLRYLAA